jgi:hypothetical protein
MEYKRHGEVPPNEAQEIIEAFKKKNKEWVFIFCENNHLKV